MTSDPTTDRQRALHFLEAADFVRDAHFRDGLSVQEIETALRRTADDADPMVGSLARDGFGLDEIAAMLAAPPTVSPSAPAGRAALRDRIRRAVCEAEGFAWDSDMLEPDEYGEVADAVLSVLPEPADRAAVLREAADALDADMERFFNEWPDEPRNSPYALGRKDAAAELRRMAAEAPQPETQAESGAMAIMLVPCSLPRCDTTPGESCSTHKRLWAHADGEHELCGAECSAAPPASDADSRSAR
jgi:hypothetical protein